MMTNGCKNSEWSLQLGVDVVNCNLAFWEVDSVTLPVGICVDGKHEGRELTHVRVHS